MPLLRISSYRNPLLIFAVLVTIYSVKALNKIYPLSGDEPQYLLDSYGITKLHSRAIKHLFMQPEIIEKIYGSPVLNFHGILESNVTYHGVGLSILLIPSILLGHYLVAARLTMVIIAALTFVVIYLLANELKIGSKKANLFSTLIIGISPPIIFNVEMIYPELVIVFLCALAILLIFKFMRKEPQPKNFLLLTLAVLLINSLIWFGPRYLVIQITILFLFLNLIFKHQKKVSNYKNVSYLIIIFVTAFNSIYYLFKIHEWYGTYDLAKTAPANMSFGEIYKLKNNIPNLYQNFFNLIFGSVEGIIPWLPLGLLLIPASFAFIYSTKNPHKKFIYPACLYFAIIFIAVSSGNKGGDTPPIHYLLPIVPLLAFPLAKLTDLFFAEFTQPKISIYAKLKKLSKSKHLILLITLLIIGGIYSVDGARHKGELFIRAASQDQPILKSARFMSKLWPSYQGPNMTSYSNAVPEPTTWVLNGEGLFGTAFSQGFRPSGNYTNSINAYNPTKKAVIMALNIRLNETPNNKTLCSKSIKIDPGEENEIILPCNVYGTKEIVWEIFSQTKEIKIQNYNMEVSKPLKNSSFDEIGHTLLLTLGLILIYRRIKVMNANIYRGV